MTGSKRISPTVEKVLRDRPASRDDYRVLVKEVYEEYGLFLSDEQLEILLKRCPSTESITRAARKIWEDGKYLPSGHIQARRAREEVNYRQEMIQPVKDGHWDFSTGAGRWVQHG